MKNSKPDIYFIFVLLSSLIMGTGCKDKHPEFTSKLIVKNASSYDVKIMVFSKGTQIEWFNRPVSNMGKGDSVEYSNNDVGGGPPPGLGIGKC